MIKKIILDNFLPHKKFFKFNDALFLNFLEQIDECQLFKSWPRNVHAICTLYTQTIDLPFFEWQAQFLFI